MIPFRCIGARGTLDICCIGALDVCQYTVNEYSQCAAQTAGDCVQLGVLSLSFVNAAAWNHTDLHMANLKLLLVCVYNKDCSDFTP